MNEPNERHRRDGRYVDSWVAESVGGTKEGHTNYIGSWFIVFFSYDAIIWFGCQDDIESLE